MKKHLATGSVRQGSLFINPGGPGGSGVQYVEGAAETAFAGVQGSDVYKRQPEASAQPASGDRPGARATLTDSDWLSDLEFVEKTVSASPTMLLDKSGDDIRIEGEVNSLSVTANNTKVFADYVSLLTISGNNVTVYVKDVDRVVIKGTNAEVVWAGNSPTVEDFGHNTETHQQGHGD